MGVDHDEVFAGVGGDDDEAAIRGEAEAIETVTKVCARLRS
jgi:hypothetical protein